MLYSTTIEVVNDAEYLGRITTAAGKFGNALLPEVMLIMDYTSLIDFTFKLSAPCVYAHSRA